MIWRGGFGAVGADPKDTDGNLADDLGYEANGAIDRRTFHRRSGIDVGAS